MGTELESSDSGEAITEPFDPSRIKVDRESMSVFQVLRKISMDEIKLDPEFQRNFVWDPVRRSRLIESALLRIPLPASSARKPLQRSSSPSSTASTQVASSSRRRKSATPCSRAKPLGC